MKIIILIFLFGFIIMPAQAYMEDNRAGETQLTAGEQNSNLHKLSSRGNEILKKLKQADAYVERAQAAGKRVNASALEDLLNSDQKDKAEQEMERFAATVKKQTADPSHLKVSPENELFTLFVKLGNEQQRDSETARQLVADLKRRAR